MRHFGELTAEQIRDFIKEDMPWPERLKIVRAIPHVFHVIEPDVMDYLASQAKGSNRFIQAWAIDGLMQLAPDDAQTLALAAAGMGSGSAAVRARIRNRLRGR